MNNTYLKLKHFVYKKILRRKYPVSHEMYDYYAASALFMNRILSDYDLYKTPILSVGGVTRHIVSDLPFYSMLIHNTMIPMEDYTWLVEQKLNIEERAGDFFELRNDEWMCKVKTCISHAAIHCMNDTRYGNRDGQCFRSYLFAKRLCELCPNIEHAIVSVPVNKEEFVVDNLVWLGDEKFICSFIQAGFLLEKKLYDKKVNNNQFETGMRFSEEFPEQYCGTVRNVIGNYYFRKE